VQVTMI